MHGIQGSPEFNLMRSLIFYKIKDDELAIEAHKIKQFSHLIFPKYVKKPTNSRRAFCASEEKNF